MKREREEKNFLRRKRNRINKVGRWPNNGFGLSHSPLNRLQYSHDGIWLGNFGLKKNEALQSDKAGCCIRLYPQEHISWKLRGSVGVTVCGNAGIINKWFNSLNFTIQERVKGSGLYCLIERLSYGPHNGPLLQAISEKWWDTTHTMHFDFLGEMTVTPKDFTYITGLRFGGQPIQLDRKIHHRRDLIGKYFGRPMLSENGHSVDVQWLYQAYGINTEVEQLDDDTTMRAFILALLGATLFAEQSNRVKLALIPSIYNLDVLHKYNWAAAGLACLYQQMDDVCRKKSCCIGGLWRTWEVWATSYIPAIHDVQAHKFPMVAEEGNGDSSILQLYRIKLTETLYKEINWSPWPEEDSQEKAIQSSIFASQKRMVLCGVEGGAWYLGERVSVQSISAANFLVPKNPPRTMLSKDNASPLSYLWTTKGKPAIKYIIEHSEDDYPQFIANFLRQDIAVTQDQGNPNCQHCNTRLGQASEHDLFPFPPWTLQIPSPIGRPKLISIPTDVEFENFTIPPHIEYVSITTASKLLRMIAGMHHVLIDNLSCARQTMTQYARMLQKLRYKLAILEAA